MKFIDIKEHGAADQLQLSETEQPTPGAGEILIAVKAAGVNRPDIVQRMGFYPPPPGASPILGLEVSGVVAAVGPGVEAWREGDEVCALCNGGGYAEFVAVPADQALPVPKGLSVQEAAALPETFFTVWSNVFDRAGLQAGERVLIHGGSSGIGTTAIQLAKAFGAEVYTTAGSAEKCAACESLGASKAINYREQDYVEEILALTEFQGVNVILDMVGGDYVERNINVAAQDGRIVNIAFLQGANVQVNMLPVMLKRLSLTGSTLRPQSPAAKAAIAQALREKVWPLIESGEVSPQIHATFPFAEVQAAHELMESSAHIGKILLTLDAAE